MPSLKFGYFFSLKAFCALGDFELHLVAFVERPVAGALDGIEMDEDAALSVSTVGGAVTFITDVCKQQGIAV